MPFMALPASGIPNDPASTDLGRPVTLFCCGDSVSRLMASVQFRRFLDSAVIPCSIWFAALRWCPEFPGLAYRTGKVQPGCGVAEFGNMQVFPGKGDQAGLKSGCSGHGNKSGETRQQTAVLPGFTVKQAGCAGTSSWSCSPDLQAALIRCMSHPAQRKAATRRSPQNKSPLRKKCTICAKKAVTTDTI
jgi:hypothetical protein